jgi:hypothetical protein
MPELKCNPPCGRPSFTISSIVRIPLWYILFLMSYVEVIQRWQRLPEAQQRRLRWQAIPQQVADSMAFEGEPVDLAWLTKLHLQTPPPAGLKPAGESSTTRS